MESINETTNLMMEDIYINDFQGKVFLNSKGQANKLSIKNLTVENSIYTPFLFKGYFKETVLQDIHLINTTLLREPDNDYF